MASVLGLPEPFPIQIEGQPVGMVESIDAMKEYLERLVPGLRVIVGHGQMDENELEKVMLAFMEGADKALYVAGLCVAIQQIEGNVLMPLVQRWAVKLPPVLGITAAVIFGILFGLVGVLFATPLMVVVMVLVQKLYIEGFLESASADATFSSPGR